MTVRETRRWYGVTAIAFFAAAAGVFTRRPGVLLAGVVGVAFAAYARAAAAPTPDLDIEREVSDAEPDPGDAVEVTLRIENGGGFLADLRIVDGVPDGLAVSAGSPRLGTALRAGKAAEFTYAVEARRGRHDFDPVTVIARDPSGAVERETTVSVETTVECRPPLGPGVGMPLRAATAQYAGPVATTTGGEGVEFHTTREYRPGDSMTRVDWGRLARTGELATVSFREERSATIAVVIDAREAGYAGGETPAIEPGIEAAGRVLVGLLDAGHSVGIGAIGIAPCWLAPSTGRGHREAARRLLATHDALAPTPPAGQVIASRRIRELRGALPGTAQVVLVTPLSDDRIVRIAAGIDAHGYPVTVLSPDVTGDDTPGRRLARTERRARINDLRSRSIPVIGWDPEDDDLEAVMTTAREGRR